ncbi:MAG TPA: lytic transglycosylase domain-containing protein [Rhizomicrobium sp.]
MSEHSPFVARTRAAAIDTVKFLFLTLLTIAAFAALKFGGFAAPTPIRIPAPVARLLAKKPAEEPPPPSAYDSESAMNAKDLIERWAPYITEASLRFGVPESWIRAVIRQESGGRTVTEGDVPITSDAGAEGLMQVMPDTYAEMKAQYALSGNAYDPHDNIIAGTAYLRWLKNRYGFPKMFAAYNDGPGNFDRYMLGKRGLPAETVAYLANVSATLGVHPHRRARVIPA